MMIINTTELLDQNLSVVIDLSDTPCHLLGKVEVYYLRISAYYMHVYIHILNSLIKNNNIN